MPGDFRTVEYWNKRTKLGIQQKDFKSMIFIDPRFDAYEERTRELLKQWNQHSVLDVACGYGRFADIFTRYHGVDFSEEMLRLATEKYPNHKFTQADIREYIPDQKYDVIYEVNSLHSLGMTHQEFIEKFAPHAHKAVACLEADYFYIHQIYA